MATELQYSCLENSMDRGAWQAAVLGVTESQTQLSAHTNDSRRGVPSLCTVENPHKTYVGPLFILGSSMLVVSHLWIQHLQILWCLPLKRF